MNYTLIAHDIVEAVLADSEGANPREVWDDAKDDYLLEYMPYDARIGEGKAGRRNRSAESKVAKIVEALLDSRSVNE